MEVISMLKRLLKSKRAQNTAEYAILISLVVAGIIAMQTYAQRALQARVRDAGQYLQQESSAIGNTVQYEPYYLDTSYNVITSDTQKEVLAAGNKLTKTTDNTRTRQSGGRRTTSYDTSVTGIVNGL
jgi:uncharacterized protein (UPF0333 family)